MDDLSPGVALLVVATLFALAAIVLACSGPGRRKRARPPERAPEAGELLAAASFRLRVRPFDQMVATDRQAVLRILERADAAASSPVLHARINLMLAEMALIDGKPERALERYQTVARWTPQAPVGLTIAALQRRLAPTIPVAVRLTS